MAITSLARSTRPSDEASNDDTVKRRREWEEGAGEIGLN